MTDKIAVEDFVADSKQVQRQTGKTFYLATLMFPNRIRKKTHILYAFFRKADEIVDTVDPDPDQSQKLEGFRRKALGKETAEDDILKGFSIVRESENICDDDVNAFIDSMKMDIEKKRYKTYEDLREYMDGSAAAVGRMMTNIMMDDPEKSTLQKGSLLGEAYQMTNFLRDVGEDIRKYDRVYIPQNTLDRFGSSTSEIESQKMTDNLKNAIEYELERTENLYDNAVEGIRMLPKDCQLAVLMSAVLYSDHHRVLRSNDYEVFESSMEMSLLRKMNLAIFTYTRWKISNDPVAVYKRLQSSENRSSLRSRIPFYDMNRRL